MKRAVRNQSFLRILLVLTALFAFFASTAFIPTEGGADRKSQVAADVGGYISSLQLARIRVVINLSRLNMADAMRWEAMAKHAASAAAALNPVRFENMLSWYDNLAGGMLPGQ